MCTTKRVIPAKPRAVFSDLSRLKKSLCDILGNIGIQVAAPSVPLWTKDAIMKIMKEISCERAIFLPNGDDMEALLYLVQAVNNIPIVVLPISIQSAGIIGMVHNYRNLFHVDTDAINSRLVEALGSNTSKEVRLFPPYDNSGSIGIYF